MSDGKILPFEHIRVPENMSFNSLESEEYRIYFFPKGEERRIDYPVAINVSRSGGHKIIDGDGITHYIPKGWIELVWKARDGANHVDF